MKEKFFKFRCNLISLFGKIFNTYKYYIITLVIVFLIAFITGIMTCTEYLDNIDCSNLINKYLLNFLKKESTYIVFFLMLSMYFLIIAIFIILFTRNYFMFIIDYILLALLSYIFGFDICIFIMNLGIAGIFFGILVLGLFGLVIFISLITIISIASKKVRNKDFCDNKSYFKLYMIFIFISEFALLLLSLLLGIIHIFVIVD